MRKAIKATATIKGVCEGEPFTEKAQFELFPPKPGDNHYGNGYWMGVRLNGQTYSVDLRYETWFDGDIEEPATRWINAWWGDNLREYSMDFDYPAKQ